MNSPLWVHMVAGLGSGLFLFDENGCAVNDLDTNDRRFGCEDVAPKDAFTTETVNERSVFNLDRIVNLNGESQASNNHPMLDPGQGPLLREGAFNVNLAGPLGRDRVRRLTDPDTGIILDSWLDADGKPHGADVRAVRFRRRRRRASS